MIPGSKVFVGTSGWHYAHWAGPFYPPGLPARDWLGHYVHVFPTVEINNFFYRLPGEASVRRWRETAPEGFVFAVKANRFITHMKKLSDPERSLPAFLRLVEMLEAKAGPILVQLPGFLKPDPGRLDAFLSAAGSMPTAGDARHWVFEFRHPGWWEDRVYGLLEKHGASFCISDLAGHATPRLVLSQFVYVRLHGPGAAYQGDYTAPQLASWADFLNAQLSLGRRCYCYFNNDQKGFAVKNALQLQRLL